MTSFQIQKATREDANWIVEAQILMAFETENLQLNQEAVVKGVGFIFDHLDGGFYIIARNDEQNPIACLLVLKEWSDWRNGEVWWIHSLYVIPDYRKQGIFNSSLYKEYVCPLMNGKKEFTSRVWTLFMFPLMSRAKTSDNLFAV